MGSLLLAPLGGALALHIAGHAVSMPVLMWNPYVFGIVAKNSILLARFAIERCQGRAQGRGHHGRRPQARPAIVMTTMADGWGWCRRRYRWGDASGARRWRWW